MRRSMRIAIAALGVAALAPAVHAQALGPQRQFLAIEPYYERTNFDVGEGFDKENTNGYGARLWVNLDPFHFILNSSIALFASYTPSQGNASFDGVTAWHYGAEYDQFLVRRPLGGVIDPFITVGGGRYRIGAEGDHQTYWTFSPGGGLRIPIPNRLELRIDAKDMMIFATPSGTNGEKRTTNNFVLQGGVGLTF
jgi:hypothetical protein